ncbi:c-type cytochrome [Shewanella sp. FJAT-52076]|uniref:c-type cytochrome n=1 Tax=Shewanella sp. FJAT-52076 TaxID=2864202 RepID=UPI001C65BDB2|nr:c-type cytochrome [Shewanella sp. FJAT-52076]
MTSKLIVAFGLLLMATTHGAQATTAPAMPPQAALCGSCHGPQGLGVEPLGPRLAGLSSEYIQKQIKDFQSSKRQNPTMTPMAMTLQGDALIAQVADYFAAQAVPSVSIQRRGEQVTFKDSAEQLAYQGDWSRELPACVTCHGPSGIGAGTFPRLAGQQASYLKSQLLAWQAGTRQGDSDSMMANVANKLSAAEIDAIAHYFANLK